jgi:hypothetical protein
MKSLLILALFVFFSLSANAQESQVSFDLNGKILTLTSDINSKINLITDYPTFKEAILYILPDSSYSLEIFYFTEGKLTRQRKQLTNNEGNELRAKATEMLTDKSPRSLLNQDGRSYLLTGNTVMGLLYYGWAVPVIFDMEDEIAYAVYCLTAAASYIVPSALTTNSDVSLASAHLSLYGGASGIIHGMLLSDLLGIDDYQGLLGVSIVTSIAENIAMYKIAQNSNMETGKADVLINYATLGGLYGLALDGVVNESLDGSLWALPPLLGTVGGYILGNYVANTQHYSQGDATISFIPTALSAYLTTSVLLVADAEFSIETFCLTNMLAGAVGTYIGNELVKGKEFTESHGNYTILATMAGALIGSGLGALMFSDSDNLRYLPIVSSLGGILGFYIAYSAYQEEGKAIITGSLDFDISPVGLAGGLSGNNFSYIDHRALKPVSLPVVSLKYTF